MSAQLDTSTLEARYLLGELSEQEEESFEKRYFSDDRLFEELQITETELIDAYVNNELPPKARQHIEGRLEKLPRLRERLVFARTFAQSISDLPTEKSDEPLVSSGLVSGPWWKRLFVVPSTRQPTPNWALAASVMVILGVAFVIVQTVRLRNESQRLATERAHMERQREQLARLSTEQRNQMAAELQEAQRRYEQAEALVKSLQERQDGSSSVRPALASLTLISGSLRSGGEIKELKLSPKDSAAQLQLVLLSVDYKTYQVVISGPGNKEIRKVRVKPTPRKMLSIQLPANNLSAGDYAIMVSGVTPTGEVEAVGDYQFRVARK